MKLWMLIVALAVVSVSAAAWAQPVDRDGGPWTRPEARQRGDRAPREADRGALSPEARQERIRQAIEAAKNDPERRRQLMARIAQSDLSPEAKARILVQLRGGRGQADRANPEARGRLGREGRAGFGPQGMMPGMAEGQAFAGRGRGGQMGDRQQGAARGMREGQAFGGRGRGGQMTDRPQFPMHGMRGQALGQDRSAGRGMQEPGQRSQRRGDAQGQRGLWRDRAPESDRPAFGRTQGMRGMQRDAQSFDRPQRGTRGTQPPQPQVDRPQRGRQTGVANTESLEHRITQLQQEIQELRQLLRQRQGDQPEARPRGRQGDVPREGRRGR